MEQDRRGSHASFAKRNGGDESRRGNSTKRSLEAKANAWEKSAMAKLVKWYKFFSESSLQAAQFFSYTWS
ncbi:hypothetical protein RHMOL_Rhmol04G0293400 [Rhododendron molle]|uniref:Uncharacterized protein n=1 Tax=Rhododendron molle TaxID=49168 RepID=A0ACC0P7A8_RHOML|nr:hypothetical protein RHMOL_Rhmol04G0293400 [Rhododendron molle]